MPFAIADFKWTQIGDDEDSGDYKMTSFGMLTLGRQTVYIREIPFTVDVYGERILIHVVDSKVLSLPMLPDNGGDNTTMSEVFELAIPSLPFVPNKKYLYRFSSFTYVNLVWDYQYKIHKQQSLIWFKDVKKLEIQLPS